MFQYRKEHFREQGIEGAAFPLPELLNRFEDRLKLCEVPKLLEIRLAEFVEQVYGQLSSFLSVLIIFLGVFFQELLDLMRTLCGLRRTRVGIRYFFIPWP